MSLQPCPECGAQVSTLAKSCPSCGGPPPQEPRAPISKKPWIVFGLIVVLAVALGLARNAPPEKSAEADTPAAASAAASAPPAPPSPTCENDWTKCEDNAGVANHYQRFYQVQGACRNEANRVARFGEPDWGGWLSSPFGRFMKGDSALKTGRMTLVENETRVPTAVGAKQLAQMICEFDLRANKVVNLTIEPI